MRVRGFLLILGLFSVVCLKATYPQKSKYGPRAQPFAQCSKLLRTAAAKNINFPALISSAQGQKNDASCSRASLTVILNAILSRRKLTADQRMISEEDLTRKIKIYNWPERMRNNKGIESYQFVNIIKRGLRAYDIEFESVEWHSIDKTNSKTIAQARRHLEEFRTNSRIFIIADFLQSAYTNDADAGHLSPVGAYAPEQNKVLILDTDWKYYRPYWVSIETYVSGFTAYPPKNHGGYFLIRLKK